MNVSPPGTSPASGRLGSLDIFRGSCIASMILVNNPGSADDTYAPLAHAEWDGWTFADTIFPAFLWIVGVAVTLSTTRRMERGEARSQLLAHAVRRAALLFACGLFLEGFPRFDPATWQVTGVLQKISVAYVIAFMVFLWTTWRGQALWLLGIFAAYLGLMFLYPLPGCGSDQWTMDCNIARYVDGLVLAGHSGWTPDHNDPDGLVTALSSTTSVLFGMMAGQLILTNPVSTRRTPVLLASGVALVLAGALLSHWVPISKILWTPSYVVFMAGLSSIAFGVCYWLVEERRQGRWLRPLEVFGLNAIAAYVVSRLGSNPLKVHVMGKALYPDLLLAIARPVNASLLFAFVNVLMVFVVISWMYHRRIFVKF